MSEVRFTNGPSWNPQRLVEASRETTRLAEPLLREAGRAQASRTRSKIHNRTGALAGSVKMHLRRRAYGYILTIGPGKGAMNVRSNGASRQEGKYDLFYGYFVERGTGTRGPRGTPIPQWERGSIPAGQGRRVPTGVGQAPQHPFSRARDEYDRGPSRELDLRIQRIIDQAIVRASRTGGR